jgi:hypothetical protein
VLILESVPKLYMFEEVESPSNIVFYLALSEARFYCTFVSHRGITSTDMSQNPICFQLSAAMPQRRSPMPHGF